MRDIDTFLEQPDETLPGHNMNPPGILGRDGQIIPTSRPRAGLTSNSRLFFKDNLSAAEVPLCFGRASNVGRHHGGALAGGRLDQIFAEIDGKREDLVALPDLIKIHNQPAG